MRGIDHNGRGRRDDCDQPCPGTERAARGKAGSARMRGATGDDNGMAAGIFMAVEAGPRKSRCPERRLVGEGERREFGQDGERDANVGDLRLAAMEAAGQQEMAGLGAEEGDCEDGLEGGASHRAGVAVYAAWHIDRDDGRSVPRRAGDEIGRNTRDIL